MPRTTLSRFAVVAIAYSMPPAPPLPISCDRAPWFGILAGLLLDQFDTPILGAPLFGLVIADRLGVAESVGGKSSGGDAAFDQRSLDRCGAALRQIEIRRLLPGVIRSEERRV